MGEAITFARGVGEVNLAEEAAKAWAVVYPTLSEGQPGLLGAVLAPGEAQAMRLAMLYALADKSCVIRVPHLKGALALWDHADASAINLPTGR